MRLDIVILPPRALSEKIGKTLRATAKRFAFNFIVDNRQLLPHVSLLHLQTKPNNLSRIISATAEIAKHQRKFKIKFDKVYHGIYKRKKYFGLAVKNNKALYGLNQNIVQNISHFRSGITHLPPKAQNHLQKAYFKKYGVGNVLKYFFPHITLGMIKNPRDEKQIFELLSRFRFPNFTASRLVVTKVNKYHQVIKIIKEFQLK